MVLTDVKKEMDGVLNSEGLSWGDLARKNGLQRKSAWGVFSYTQNFVPASVVRLLDSIGYDIEINFVKRPSAPSGSESK